MSPSRSPADPAALPHRVLCIASQPSDVLVACGGMLSIHAGRDDAVRVLVLTTGLPEERPEGDHQRLEAAAVDAHRLLGIKDVHFLGLSAGELEENEELDALVDEAVASFRPELVYGPAAESGDRGAAHAALLRALARDGRTTVLLYDAEGKRTGDVLYETSDERGRKRAALELFAGAAGLPMLVERVQALDRARTLRLAGVACAAEGFLPLEAHGAAEPAPAQGTAHAEPEPEPDPLPAATAVLTSFNKREEVRANLAAVFAQTRPFAKVVVVDNASSDGTAEMIRAEFPAVHLVVMPHSGYGACETFNIGFSNADTPLVAILDDDIVMPPEWLEKSTRRMLAEPQSTAIVSTKVVEPGMPESYRDSPEVNAERYMSTFRGCASLARTAALREAEYYDERLFIYGNERDLTCRLLNLGYRVLQYPGVEVFHHTPFGIKPGKRSLYYHARNAWISMLKYAPAKDLVRLPFLALSRVVFRSKEREASGEVAVAVGTIGIGRSLRETPGAWWIVLKAMGSVLWNVPYCLKHRRPVRAADFELPLH